MRVELKRMGLSLDWEREFATCDPAYYGHQQKLFLDFLRAGLVERKESWVNWDPVDGTVLANEQVIDGQGWRSGALVEKKQLSQWFLRITEYAPQLLDALNTLDRWPERVRVMQEKWIGRSEGARLRFALDQPEAGIRDVEVYTTRPDTLFGMSFLALAPEHPLAAAVAAQDSNAAAFIAECRRTGTSEAVIETAEKRGYDTGLRVRHPFTDQTFPVWIANFVLMEYGTGAIFGCPAHDQRDLDFARAYGLHVRPVVLPRTPIPPHSPLVRRRMSGRGRSTTRASSTGWMSRPQSAARSNDLSSLAWAAARSTGGCATGVCRASAGGAVRSRSFTVRHAAWCPCRMIRCR